jgi:hypothetical protein
MGWASLRLPVLLVLSLLPVHPPLLLSLLLLLPRLTLLPVHPPLLLSLLLLLPRLRRARVCVASADRPPRPRPARRQSCPPACPLWSGELWGCR